MVKHLFINSFAVLTLMCVLSCGNEQSFKTYTLKLSELDMSMDTVINGHFYHVELTDADAWLAPYDYLGEDLRSYAGYTLVCFNYDGELRVNNGTKVGVTSFALAKSYACVNIEEDDISISSEHNSKRFGKWAKADVTISGAHCTDVYVTPYAYKALLEKEERCSFLFVMFFRDGMFKPYIYRTNARSSLIVSHASNRIFMPEAYPGDPKPSMEGWRYPNHY